MSSHMFNPMENDTAYTQSADFDNQTDDQVKAHVKDWMTVNKDHYGGLVGENGFNALTDQFSNQLISMRNTKKAADEKAAEDKRVADYNQRYQQMVDQHTMTPGRDSTILTQDITHPEASGLKPTPGFNPTSIL